jgi:hypothetical protein
MSFWKRLFGAKPDEAHAPAAKGEEYNGFLITPTPIREGGQFRVAARIEKDGQRHDLIRADTMGAEDEAITASLRKARQIIDEQGDLLFRP